ncbi:MAG TPA: ADYC domain-containing protein [Kofleriaceae bacterium]|nr:ADYC domain-containing protein [Kofleriaceae bacterium]
MKAIWSVALLCTACATNLDEDVGAVRQDVDSNNGTSLNGTSLNGTSLNGTSLNGTSLNGTSLNGTSLNGTSLNGTSLNGSTWTGTASNGTTVNLRIDSATQGDVDTWFYAVSYETETGWSPLCGVDGGGVAIQAIAVPGTWGGTASYAASSSQFTWACRHKSIAKCVELGYKPWDGASDEMASCVRLLRADYCGDGTSYTVDNTLLNLYDASGIQADTEAWPLEAEWTPAGARCVGTNGETRAQLVSHTSPPCLAALVSSSCGTFDNGAVLIDELSPQY